MIEFTEVNPSTISYWRAIILFGRNVASYKFALGKALLELSKQGKTFVTMEEVADPYSRHLIDHLNYSDKQGTFSSSKFLDECRKYIRGEISKDELIEKTVRLGFVYVLDAFHFVNNEAIPNPFFEEKKSKGEKGLILTDNLLEIPEMGELNNLIEEVESRWKLVETSWKYNISRNMLEIKYDEDLKTFFLQENLLQRVNVTSSRGALNGYQKGKCFYCFDKISINPKKENLTEVDHFIPFILENRLGSNLNINGVWNLVLACNDCNRGEDGKFAKVPALKYLQRLHKRNEFLIGSNHPLKETLVMQTGQKEEQRKQFLQRMYDLAKINLIVSWEIPPKAEETF